MANIFSILIAVISATIVLIVIIVTLAIIAKKNNSKSDILQSKKRTPLIRDCLKRLARDPRNISALSTLGDLYFNEQNWEKAFPMYNLLLDLVTSHIELDTGQIALRQGICAFKIEKFDDAMRGLTTACKYLPNNFDAYFYLGQLMSQKNEYEKAITCFRKARLINPDDTTTNWHLGMSYYNSKHYRECLPFLRRFLEENPADKEALFTIASAMQETGFSEKALNIFTHLRTDSQFGAQSCLASGLIHEHINQYENAIQDYEIGTKLENVSIELQALLRYKLANAYIATKNIGKALELFKDIQNISPGYKDVPTLIQKYQELNTNTNLQIYLLSSASDFVSICRRFVIAYYQDALVKIEDVSIQQGFVEILCNVETSRWEETELFRFYRTTGSIGELYIREFHSKLRDIKCDRGFCITPGNFTEGATRFVEGRPIDLIEKERLISVLKKLT